MAYDYQNNADVYIRSGNVYLIARPTPAGTEATIADFAAAGKFATIEANNGITITRDKEEQSFEGMDEDIQLQVRVKDQITFTIGEATNEIIATLTGQDAEGTIYDTTEVGYSKVDVWSNAAIKEYAMMIKGVDPSDMEVGYVYHNVTATTNELPPFKGKEKPALQVTFTADMNAGGSPGYAFIQTA